MRIELNKQEVEELMRKHIETIISMDLSGYDVELEVASQYSSRNPGGLEITLRKKASAEQEAA